MNLRRLPVIVGALPVTLQNGTTADATQVMSDFNWIVNQVNANAAPLANTALTNVNNNFTVVQSGTAAIAPANFPIASQVQNWSFNTLSSVMGTNALTSRVVQLPLTAHAVGQVFGLLPSQNNTGAVSMTIDATSQRTLLNMGSNLTGTELRGGVVALVMDDGQSLQLIGGTPYVQGPNVPATGTLNLDALFGDEHHVTGTGGPITAVTLSPGRQKLVVFDSSPVYTNGASLLLIGAQNRTPVSGETSLLRGEPGGVVREVGAAPTARMGSSKVLLGSKIAATSAALQFTNADFDWTAFNVYEFEFVNLIPATDATSFVGTVSTDGSTFQSANYVYAVTGVDSNGTTASINSTSAASFAMASAIGNATVGGGLSGFAKLIGPSNSAIRKKIYGQLAAFNSANYIVTNFMGAYTGAQTAILGVRFNFGSGNIASGTIYAYGIRKQ